MREIVRYRSEHFEGVDALWKDAFPNDNAWNVAAVAIPEKTRFQPDLMLVVLEDNVIVGSVMAGYDGHRGWISRIAVLRSHQKKELGKRSFLPPKSGLQHSVASKSICRWSSLIP